MTIKELSDKCCVSEQSIRNWCKKNNVPKASQPKQASQGKATKASYVITKEVEDEILTYYGALIANIEISESTQSKTINATKTTQAKQSNKASLELENELIKQLNIKDEQLSVKDTQLAEKDKQIYELQVQNKALIEALNNAQENNKSLTDALVAAQTLHAVTIQTTALVDKSAEPERKWWQKIFKKNK